MGRVEEGEISDSGSLREISEEDLGKRDANGAVVVAAAGCEGGGPKVWTMQDLYKYQIKRGYTSGLHNLALAQAVKSKPSNRVLDMEIAKDGKDGDERIGNGGLGKGAKEVVIDEGGDVVFEKEEGEIEEGEFSMEVDSCGGKGKEDEVSKDAEGGDDGGDAYESEIDMDDDDIEQRLLSIQEALDNFISVNAEM